MWIHRDWNIFEGFSVGILEKAEDGLCPAVPLTHKISCLNLQGVTKGCVPRVSIIHSLRD